MKAHGCESVEVRYEQRLTTSSLRNSACYEVTSSMKPEERRCQAVTEVKVLSPEKSDVLEVDLFLQGGRQYRCSRKREGVAVPTGSEATA